MRKQRAIEFDGDWNSRAGGLVLLGMSVPMITWFSYAALTDSAPGGRLEGFELQYCMGLMVPIMLVGLAAVLSRRTIRVDPARGELQVLRWIVGIPRHRIYSIDGRGTIRIDSQQVQSEATSRILYCMSYVRDSKHEALFSDTSLRLVRRRAEWLAKRLDVGLDDTIARAPRRAPAPPASARPRPGGYVQH